MGHIDGGERGRAERAQKQEGRHQNDLFYAYDDMVASSDQRWLQGDFSTLVGMFDRVGLKTNVAKSVRVVFRPCQVARTQLEAAYKRQTKGSRPSYQERQWGWVQCMECGEEMAIGSLEGHIQTQHGKEAGGTWCWEATAPGGELHTYRMALPTALGPRNCPIEGCPGQAATRTVMQVHLFHRNIRDTVTILEEGTPPHPRFTQRNMLVPWRALNGRHLSTYLCAKGDEKKRRRLAEEELRESL